MIIRVSVLAFLAGILSSRSFVLALSSSDIPSDTPISSLLASGNAHLAKGETSHALTYYDVAISRDPNNYLTFFKRGATYLSLGRITQAQQDFEKVLILKPGFEGALLQRGKIRKMHGEWAAAMEDFVAAGETDMADLLEAQGAAALAVDAEKSGNWEECITQAGVAIMVANKNLSLRQTRAHCRFERGEVEEGISDLLHVLQMQPGLTDPHLQISAILFYALENTERGIAQIRKCLHSDPESKSCKKLHKQEKSIVKTLTKIKASMERKQFAGAAKLLVPTSEDPGLIQDIKDDVKELRDENTIPPHAPNKLVALVVEMACEAYTEVS
jgi:DnaJ homolog subfamily C member 3